MATYVFSFPAAAAGKAVTVRDSAGSTVDTGTVGVASGVQGKATYTASLDAGDYVAEAANAGIHFSSRAVGVRDVEAELDARVADFVADADDTNAASVAAAVDALRDALIAAGLMAGS